MHSTQIPLKQPIKKLARKKRAYQGLWSIWGKGQKAIQCLPTSRGPPSFACSLISLSGCSEIYNYRRCCKEDFQRRPTTWIKVCFGAECSAAVPAWCSNVHTSGLANKEMSGKITPLGNCWTFWKIQYLQLKESVAFQVSRQRIMQCLCQSITNLGYYIWSSICGWKHQY